MQASILDRGQEIVKRTTRSSNYTMTAPLLASSQRNNMNKAFLNSSMLVVILFLGTLVAQLLYSLILADVDTKTYTFGMLRALGMTKPKLMALITIQSSFFSIPGFAGGIVVAWVLNTTLRFVIFEVSFNYTNFRLDGWCWLLAVIFGLFVPMLANVLPTKSALGKNLRSSLDLNHRSEEGIQVKQQRLSDMVGLSLTQIVAGLMLVILGVVTFYLVPSSFLNKNLDLFFDVFNLILLMIIFGLTFLAVLIFALFERIIKWIVLNTCCCKDRHLSSLIQKNMDGHRKRNSKTSIMLTLSLAFAIFSAAAFKMINRVIESELEVIAGADLYANCLKGSSFIDEPATVEFLEKNREKLDGYSFVSASINTVLKQTSNDNKMYTSGMSGYDLMKTDIFGVPENYLSVIN